MNHDAAWEAFDANPPAVIAYSKVPWPPDEDDVLRGMVLASCVPPCPALTPLWVFGFQQRIAGGEPKQSAAAAWVARGWASAFCRHFKNRP